MVAVPDTYRLLVVEDDPVDAALIKVAFVQHDGHARMNIARSAEEAIAYLEQPWQDDMGSVGLPDVILLDLQMPGMGGQGFLEWYHPQSRIAHVPVVVYTSTSTPDSSQDCFAMGAAGYLEKSTDLKDLVGAVRRAIAEHLARMRRIG